MPTPEKPQPPFEKRLLILPPDGFTEALLRRRQHVAILTPGGKVKDPILVGRLSHEIALLTARAGVLKADSQAPTLDAIGERQQEIGKKFAELDKNNNQDWFIREGLQLRLRLLAARAQTLKQAAPEPVPVPSPASAIRPRVRLLDQEPQLMPEVEERMGKEEEMIQNYYDTGRVLYIDPIRGFVRQTNPYGMNSCWFASADNALRYQLRDQFNPARHSEAALINSLDGENYARLNQGGESAPGLMRALQTQAHEVSVSRTNSLYQILRAVENGASAIVPLSRAGREGIGHVGAILPGHRVRRGADGNLEIQVIDPSHHEPVFLSVQYLVRNSGLVNVMNPNFYVGVIIQKRPPVPVRPPAEPARVPVRPRPPQLPPAVAEAKPPIREGLPEQVNKTLLRAVQAQLPRRAQVRVLPPEIARPAREVRQIMARDLLGELNNILRGSRKNIEHAATTPANLMEYLKTIKLPEDARIKRASAYIIGSREHPLLEVEGVISKSVFFVDIDAVFSALYRNQLGSGVIATRYQLDLPAVAESKREKLEDYIVNLNSVVINQLNKFIEPGWQATNFRIEDGNLVFDFRKK